MRETLTAMVALAAAVLAVWLVLLGIDRQKAALPCGVMVTERETVGGRVRAVRPSPCPAGGWLQ